MKVGDLVILKALSIFYVDGDYDFREVVKEKLKEEDLQYIEQEFNNIVLEEGYVSLFNFLKLKEFFKLITAEDS